MRARLRDRLTMTPSSGAPEFDRLKDIRVFVVEDEAAIALLLEDMLLDFGCIVVGPAARVAGACDAAREEAIDVAVLDLNVAGESVAPVVEILSRRAIPFVFSTGYGSAGVDPEHRHRPVLDKPFTQHDLGRKLLSALGN
jgi:CheY-like chemotaxis protein